MNIALLVILLISIVCTILGGKITLDAKISGTNALLSIKLFTLFSIRILHIDMDASLAENKLNVMLFAPFTKKRLYPAKKNRRNNPHDKRPRLYRLLSAIKPHKLDIEGTIDTGDAPASIAACSIVSSAFYSAAAAFFKSSEGIFVRIMPSFVKPQFFISISGIFHVNFPHVIAIILKKER